MMSFLVLLPVFDKSVSLCSTGKLLLEFHILVLVIPVIPHTVIIHNARFELIHTSVRKA